MTNPTKLPILIKQRTALKKKLMKFSKYINDEKNKGKLTEIKLRLEKIENILDHFEEIHAEISEVNDESSSELDSFEEQYYEIISKARDMIDSNQPEGSVNLTAEIQKNNFRLPQIDLETFDGTYEKWLDFSNSFKTIVDSDTRLSKLQKLHYLRSCLKNDALSVINALESTEENYPIAWELLEKRFDNKRVIIQNHVKALMELSTMSKESACELRKLLDTIQNHLRALKSLGQPVDKWDTLLIYIITSKIDRNSHREWEKSIIGSDMPTMKCFLEFLEQRCQVLQVTAINVIQSQAGPSSLSNGPRTMNKKRSFTSTTKPFACVICQKPHKLYCCDAFKNMTIKERYENLKSMKLCFNCFNEGHRNTECKWSGCKICNSKHNTLLHVDKRGKVEEIQEKELNANSTNESTTIKVHSAIVTSQVLLSTALIHIKGKNGEMVPARVLLDNGSQSHFITRKLAEFLKLPLQTVNLPVEGLNNLETRIKHTINAQIYSKLGNYKETIEFLVLPRICQYLPNQFINKNTLNLPKNIILADPKFYEPNEIDALLGADIFYDLLCVGQIELPECNIRLQETKLGWIIAGKITNYNKNPRPSCMLVLNSLQKTMEKFWEIEETESKTFISEEEFQVEEHFKKTTTRDSKTGRYIVRLPFNEKINKLGESFSMAQKQFFTIEKRLAKNPDLKMQYINCMREAVQLGHMREIKLNEITGKHCFLPHHPVIKESSNTTKVRIVYNASAKTSTGISLNECLKVGAVVQNTSFDIMLRFRSHQIALMGDIEKMYKQIILHEDDAKFQLSFWRENETSELKTYIIPVVLFGSASAPHSATRVLKQLAEDEQTRFPKASEILKRDFYVDDCITGADTVKDAIKLREDLSNLTKAGGFTLRKWVSNKQEVIESMVDAGRNIDLLTENNSEVKALGIQWNNSEDIITYTYTENLNSQNTKRGVLSNIARLYDPIGLIGPVIVSAKIIMQKLWQCNSSWDEKLPDSILQSWNNIKDQLSELNKLKFNRKVIIENAINIQIHGFCDASEKAYGACIYIRSVDKNNHVMVQLLCSKNRIAPLKTISLPKLELCAALLLSCLMKTVLNAMYKTVNEIYLWSDSSITLQWINTQPYLLKTFVANRVSEIRDITKTMRWRHVRSEDNMADILSRGQLPNEFAYNNNWKVGPEWLQSDEVQWPSGTMILVPLCELKSTQTFTIKQKNPNSFIYNYSSLHKIKRIMSYALRFINNTSRTKYKLSGPLSANELEQALFKILKLTQEECFRDEFKQLIKGENVNPNSRLKALNPFLDEKGLIRVGGRLKNSALSYFQKHPIVIPSSHHITKLIIREQHLINFHGGTQATLNAVRLKYWPINGRIVTKDIIRKCVTCFRAKPADYSYFMGDLPRNRVIQTRPFLNTGIDFCGPFFIKEKKFRNRGKVKIYACIFVCFATKAIHIELASDLSTETFLGCLRRFFARRGRALNLYSDNATNFSGARNELVDLFKISQSDECNVNNFLIQNNTSWHFIPPRSPHFGGIWEAAVKSFKHHYLRVVGEKLFTYEELVTYTTEIEAILNSRPITPLSEDPNDLRALTPAHFLIGDTLIGLPDVDLVRQPENRLSTWQHIQYMKQHFWNRWYKEYLNELNTRSKWQAATKNDIKNGTMVLLKEDNAQPLHWPLGRVIEVYPGEDGHVRVVKVKTHSGEYKRSITRIAPLPINDVQTN